MIKVLYFYVYFVASVHSLNMLMNSYASQRLVVSIILTYGSV
jgi:hypothetical protein